MKKSALTLSLFAVASLCQPALSLAVTWDGGGTNSNWSTANNWNPNGVPTPGVALMFPTGASKLSNNNDFSAATAFQSLTFTAANYILGGNDIQLSNGILSGQPSGTNQIQLGVALSQNQSFNVQNAGAFLTDNGGIDLKTFTLSFGGEGNWISNGTILGSGEIQKTGPGFLRLSGNNTFTGGITVSGGSLQIDNGLGSGSGTGPVVIESGAELQGNGAIAGDVLIQAGAKVSPGGSDPALLAVGNLTLENGAAYVTQLNGPTPDSDYSVLQVTGTVSLNQSDLRPAPGPNVQIGDTYKIIDNDGNDPVVGIFRGLSEGQTFHLVGVDGFGFTISYKGGDGNDVVLTAVPTASVEDVTVTEPSVGQTTAIFVVKLNQASDQTITIKYATAPGTALAGEDYEVANGTLTFAPGVTQQTVAVTIHNGPMDEAVENFSFKIFTPTNASIDRDTATGTINPPTSSSSGSGNTGGNGSGDIPPPVSADGGCSLHSSGTAAGGFGLEMMLLGLLALGARLGLRTRR